MLAPPPSGYGPWYVALLVNAHANPSKKTDIRLHTYIPLLIEAMNQDPGNQWIPVMMFGPFELWDAALVFKDKWESTTRNLRNRVQEGWKLFQEYYTMYDLVAHMQPKYMEEYVTSRGWNRDTDITQQQQQPQRPTKRIKRGKRRKHHIKHMCHTSLIDGVKESPRVPLANIRNTIAKQQRVHIVK